jgi:hypothetical protein
MLSVLLCQMVGAPLWAQHRRLLSSDIDKFVYRRFQRTPCSCRRRASSAGAVAPQRPQVQGRTWFARTIGVVTRARRNGPVQPHAKGTAELRRHTCSALLPRQRIGSEIVAVIKLNINMAVAYIWCVCAYIIYIYEIWLSLAIKIMALHTTPLESLSHAQGMYMH